MDRFYGRAKELESLERQWNLEGVRTCAIFGRRRVGKTFLLRKFAENKRALLFQFVGRSEYEIMTRLHRTVSAFLKYTVPEFNNLTEAMFCISDICRKEKTLVIFDEFPYLSDTMPQGPSIVQAFIDCDLSGTDTMVVICGSSVSTMKGMIGDSSSPLYGRFQSIMEIFPMSFRDCAEFHPSMSETDLMKTYMTIGGIPFYHHVMDRSSYKACITEGFLTGTSPLRIMGMTSITEELPGPRYTAIVSAIADGATSQKVISEKVQMNQSDCKVCLDKLEMIGAVGRKKTVIGGNKRPVYVLTDPLVDFYYSVIRDNDVGPNRISESTLDTFLGKRFESLCGEWLDISMDVKARGTWWGRISDTDTDIDIVARIFQNDGKIRLLLGECKYTKNKVGFNTLRSLENKAEGIGLEPHEVDFILFSNSGFEEELIEYCQENGIRLVDGQEMFRTFMEQGETPPICERTSVL